MIYRTQPLLFRQLLKITIQLLAIAMLASPTMTNAGVYNNGTLDAFNGVAENGSELIAVGDLGMIYTRSLASSSEWGRHFTGRASRLLDVASAASYEDIAVGELGVILTRRSGNTYWSPEDSNTLGTLRKALVDPNNGTNIVVGDDGLILLYNKTINSWNPQVSGTTENLTAIMVNGDSSLYVVLGASGSVITSTDATNWVVQDVAPNYAAKDAVYYKTLAGTDRYLSVGGVAVYESSDGINWSYLTGLIQNDSPYSYLNSISYSAATNTLRVVGNNGLDLTSTDDGASWTGNYGRITMYAPLNLQDSIYTATYGQTTVGSISGINGQSQINDIYYNSTTKLYVAVGDRSVIILSSNGQSWSNSNYLPSIPEDIISLTFGGGKYAALTLKGNVLTSTNGIDWTSDSITSGSLALTLRDIALDNTGNVYVALQDNNIITWSDDETVGGSSFQPYLNSVIYSVADSQFVAVGDNKIVTSPDGLTWTSRSAGAVQGELRRLQDVMYNSDKNMYVAVGKSIEGHLIMTSPDAVNWTIGTIEDMTYSQKSELYGVTYDPDANGGAGQYVAVGWGIVVVSQDGIEWTVAKDASGINRFKSIVYDGVNKQYVAVGDSAVSIFTPQMRLPVFTTASPVARIESILPFMSISASLAGIEASDFTGRKIRPALVTTSHNRFYSPGAYTLTWKATDRLGNTALFDQSVIVEDTTAPILTLNGDAAVTVEAGSADPDQGVSVEEVMGTVVVVTGGTFVDTSTLGDFTITYNAMDASGNAATEIVRNITVVDTVPPSLTIGTTNLVLYTTGEFTSLTNHKALAQPIVSDATAVTLSNDAPAKGYVVGDTLVTWTATDAAGNTSTVTQTVTIQPDVRVPQISLLGLPIITLAYGDAYTDPGARVSDDVDKNINLVVVNPVNVNSVGTYTVTYNATDYTGNKATEVTRTVNVVDRQAPVVTLSGLATMRLELGTVFNDPGASVTDNVDTNLAITVTGSVNTNVEGAYLITYSATDTAGYTGRVTRNVEIFQLADTELPVIIAPMPLVITSLDGNGIANGDPRIQAFLSGASATDNIGVVAFGPGGTPGTFPVGTTNVTFDAWDAAGNKSVAISSITVVVVDTTAPEIVIQDSVTLNSDDGLGISINNDEVQAFLNSVQVTDDSGVFTLTYSTLPDTLPIGETSVTLTAIDEAGNEKQLTARIVVIDNSATVVDKGATENGNDSGNGNASGGSIGWFIFLMAGLIFLTRRLKVYLITPTRIY